MQLSVNTNATATSASFKLSRAYEAHRRSLERLSSGERMLSPADDAGGLSVASKLGAKLHRIEKVGKNLENSLSFLKVQEGCLQMASVLLQRMSELKTMSMDASKNSADNENYNKEFIELQLQLAEMSGHKFNGVSLFTDPSVQDHALQSMVSETGKANEVVSLSRNYLAGSFVGSSGVMLGGEEVPATFSLADTVALNLPDLAGSAGEKKYTIDLETYQGVLTLWQPVGNQSDNFRAYQGSELIHDKTYGTTVITMNDGRILSPEPGSSTLYPNKVNMDEIEFGLNGNQSTELTIVVNESGQAGGRSTGWKLFAEIKYLRPDFADTYTEFGELDKFSISDFDGFIESLADALAQNAAEQQNLNMEIRHNQTTQINFEAAFSRIADADMALESTRYAKTKLLVQSSASMVGEANKLSEVGLPFLVDQ